MKALATISFLLLVTGIATASSDELPLDYEVLIKLSYQSYQACRMGEVPEPALTAACESSRVYWQTLLDSGYCFDTAERVWAKCPN